MDGPATMRTAVVSRVAGRRGAAAGRGGEPRQIPPQRLRVGPFRTRSEANAGRGVGELAESISRLGIIEPLVVRPREDGTFDLIAGERRLTAARRLGLAKVPCIIRRCSDSEAMSVALVENLQRCDLNPIERALCIRRLVEEFEVTQSSIGTVLGMSQSSVAHHLKLLSLPGAIRKFIERGDLTMGHGKVLGRVSGSEQAVALAYWCVQLRKSVRQLEAEIDRMQRTQAGAGRNGRPKQVKRHCELPNGVYLVIRENRDGSGSGILEVPYYSANERDWVIKTLSLK